MKKNVIAFGSQTEFWVCFDSSRAQIDRKVNFCNGVIIREGPANRLLICTLITLIIYRVHMKYDDDIECFHAS